MASFIASLISTTVFSCSIIIRKWFSNDQLALENDKLGLANTTCHWNAGVMVADNGPLYAYVDISLKNLPFPATIVIYNINNVYTVFLINFMLF